jgi:hypothetical protein
MWLGLVIGFAVGFVVGPVACLGVVLWIIEGNKEKNPPAIS